MKKKVLIGLFMAIIALILLNSNQPFIGLPLFILGIFLTIHKRG